MRSTLLTSCVLLLACQEYNIDTQKDLPEEPLDTDVAASILLPDIAVEPAALDFGYLPENCRSEEKQITVRNDGDADLAVTNIELRGDGDEASYSLAGRLRILAPGEEMLFAVDFAPERLGDLSDARVIVESNDPDEPRLGVDLYGAGAEDAIFEEPFAQPDAASVDVLFIVDNSGSMSGELTELASSFQTFIDAFVGFGLDFQIGVVTTDMDNPRQSGRLVGPLITPSTSNPVQAFTAQTALGASGSGDERGMDAAYAALTAPLVHDENDGFLRPDANLAIVVVSDEDDSSSMRPSTFANWLETLKADPSMTSFSGMVGPDGGGIFPTPACPLFGGADAEHAPTYHQAIRLTGGVWGNICQFRVDDFLNYLSFVAAGLLSEFPLTHTPSDEADIVVRIDGVDVPWGPPNGWSYDPGSNSVTLLGDGLPGPGASIVISYPYQTSCD